jgi:hypothetical protein
MARPFLRSPHRSAILRQSWSLIKMTTNAPKVVHYRFYNIHRYRQGDSLKTYQSPETLNIFKKPVPELCDIWICKNGIATTGQEP